jgi:hypothetical protein
MKKIILSAVTIMTIGFASAQENSVKANPLSLFGGTDLVSFEHKLGYQTSGVVGIGISSFNLGGAKYSSLGGELQYRYYFDEALYGWYAGGQIGYSAGKVTIDGYSDYETNYSAFKLGPKGGYQFLWDSGFTLDLNLGFAYNKFSYADSNGSFSTLKASGLLPNFGLGLGYSF